MFPELRISDSIVIPTYLIYLSCLYCFLIIYVFKKASRSEKAKAQEGDLKIALDLSLIMMLTGFVGGRLLHVLYEMPEYYLENPSRLFKVWEGGFVFYGGFAFAFIGSALYLWKKKLSFLLWADFFAPVLALGYGLGRVSCFLAGCCYGRFCTLPWALRFPWDASQVPRHPTQIYAVLWELVLFVLLLLLPKLKLLRTGALFSTWLIFHGLGRLMMEYYREDFRGEILLSLSLSSWISFVIILLGVGFLYRIYSAEK